jgi:hypothetical protein
MVTAVPCGLQAFGFLEALKFGELFLVFFECETCFQGITYRRRSHQDLGKVLTNVF